MPWVIAALVVLLFAWSPAPLNPGPGLDNSWHGVLHMAPHRGLTFGTQLVFTYGPLGFLSQPQFWYADTGTLALIYTAVLRLTLGVVLFLAARRSYGPIVGLMLALLVAGTAEGDDPVSVIVFAVLVLVLERDRSDGVSLAAAGAVGAMAGIQLLVKLSIGIEVTALALVFAAVVPARRLRHLGAAVGCLIAALLVGWAVAGQPWHALRDYLLNGSSIVSGYAGAQAVEDPGLRWQFPAAVLVFAVGVGGMLATIHVPPARRRFGPLGLWLVLAFFSFKEGFVRHDADHAVVYFATLLGGFLALRWRSGQRAVGFALTVLLFVIAIAASTSRPGATVGGVIDPVARARSAVDDLTLVFSPRDRRSKESQGRLAVALFGPAVDPGTLSLLKGHTVDVLPYETPVVWGYRLRWAPLPVFQAYSAYTRRLDTLNERTIESSRAPERILVQKTDGFYNRFPSFDAPATTRAVLCRYAELRATAQWLVLARRPNRCGPAQRLGSMHAAWGQSVTVPTPSKPRMFVYVRISGVQPAGLEVIQSVLYKPRTRTIGLDGARYRLIPGTADDGLILRAPVSDDYTRPFNVAPNTTKVDVQRSGGQPGGHPLRFDFYGEAIRPGG